jgi:ketosteroid isomerase-like protein
MTEQHNRKVVERFWTFFDQEDYRKAGELVHDDYIADWPQSGERIRGRENLVALNEHYPGSWRITIRRIIVEGDRAASDVVLTYRDQAVSCASFFEFKGGKIIHQVDYWADPMEAQSWRKAWVEPIGD